MYCVKCGVELEDGVKKCPLCETPVPQLDDLEKISYESEYPKININFYELRMKKIKKNGIFVFFFNFNNYNFRSIFSEYDNVP